MKYPFTVAKVIPRSMLKPTMSTYFHLVWGSISATCNITINYCDGAMAKQTCWTEQQKFTDIPQQSQQKFYEDEVGTDRLCCMRLAG